MEEEEGLGSRLIIMRRCFFGGRRPGVDDFIT